MWQKKTFDEYEAGDFRKIFFRNRCESPLMYPNVHMNWCVIVCSSVDVPHVGHLVEF